MVLSQILRLQFLLFISTMSIMWQSSTWNDSHIEGNGDRIFQLCDWCDLTETKSVQNISQSGVCLGYWNSTNSSYQSNNCALIVPQVIYSTHSYCSKHYFNCFCGTQNKTFWTLFHYSFIHTLKTIFLKVSVWKLFIFATFKYNIFESK